MSKVESTDIEPANRGIDKGPDGSGSRDSTGAPSATAIPSELLGLADRFIKVQAQELALRKDEADLRRLELTQENAYAIQALNIQAKDASEKRKIDADLSKLRMFFGVGTVLFVFGSLVFLAIKQHESFATELVKTIVPLVATGGGMFAWGRNAPRRAGKSEASSSGSDDHDEGDDS